MSIPETEATVTESNDPDATVIWTPAAPERKPLSCTPCGEVFARAAFGGSALFLAETLHDAALAAGWTQDGGTWTCTVCIAKATAQPAPPAAEPATAPEPAPATDPYEQYASMSAELDAQIARFWSDINQDNNRAHFKIHARIDDAAHRKAELSGDVAA